MFVDCLCHTHIKNKAAQLIGCVSHNEFEPTRDSIKGSTQQHVSYKTTKYRTKRSCDVAGFLDYSLLETAIRSRCCPENRAICSDVWKRHLLAPATRHTNIQDQGRRQQETHTPTAKTVYRKNDCSPTARHRIRNEKRARNQREFHNTSSNVLSVISRNYQTL